MNMLIGTKNILLTDNKAFQNNLRLAKESIQDARNKLVDQSVLKTNVGRVFLGVLIAAAGVLLVFYDLAQLGAWLFRGIKTGHFYHLNLDDDSVAINCFKKSYRMFHSKANPMLEELNTVMNTLEEINNFKAKVPSFKLSGSNRF